MKRPAEGSAEFLNLVMEEAWGRIEPIMTAVAERYMADGYMVGFVKPTWAELQKLPEQEAIATIARMLMQPFWRREGFAFAVKLIDGMEQVYGPLPGQREQLAVLEQSYG